jgi:hypothetical protein
MVPEAAMAGRLCAVGVAQQMSGGRPGVPAGTLFITYLC